MIRLKLLFLVIALISCKYQNNGEADRIVEQELQHQHDEGSSGIPKSLDDIPNPLDLISKEEMEDIIGLEPGGIYGVVPNEETESAAKTVFYRISDLEKSNAAILISAYGNPFTNELVDESWAFLSIDNLKAVGAGNLDNPDEFEKYEDWDMGIDGACSKGVGKYFWRDSNHIVYFIAFNTSLSLNQQHELAFKIGRKITP